MQSAYSAIETEKQMEQGRYSIHLSSEDMFFYVAIVFDFTISGFIEKAAPTSHEQDVWQRYPALLLVRCSLRQLQTTCKPRLKANAITQLDVHALGS